MRARQSTLAWPFQVGRVLAKQMPETNARGEQLDLSDDEFAPLRRARDYRQRD